MIIDLLNSFDPEPDGLLRQISKHVDNDILQRISIADCGEDADLHLAALRQVRDTGAFPVPMQWCPAEVLELIRWSEPENPDWKPGETGELGHWMRAFSCAALLRVTREPWNYGDGLGTDSTLVQLVLSLSVLPVNFSADATKFLAWLLLHSEPEGFDGQVCAYGLGLFWFALQLPARYADESLISLARWIIRRADEVYESPDSALRRKDALSEGHSPEPRNGFRVMVNSCLKGHSWKIFAMKLLDLDLSGRSPELRNLSTMISEQLLG